MEFMECAVQMYKNVIIVNILDVVVIIIYLYLYFDITIIIIFTF